MHISIRDFARWGVAAALAFAPSCSDGWVNTPLFDVSGKQLTVSTAEAGQGSPFPNHYFLSYSGAVGTTMFQTVGVAQAMPGEPSGLDVVDLDGDGNEDVLLSFINTTLDGEPEPRFHCLIQERTATSLQLGEVRELPLIPGGLIGADATSVVTDVSSGQVQVHVKAGEVERRYGYDWERGSWEVL